MRVCEGRSQVGQGKKRETKVIFIVLMVLHNQYAEFGTVSHERASQPGQVEQLKGS